MFLPNRLAFHFIPSHLIPAKHNTHTNAPLMPPLALVYFVSVLPTALMPAVVWVYALCLLYCQTKATWTTYVLSFRRLLGPDFVMLDLLAFGDAI